MAQSCEEWLDFMNLDLLKTGNVVIRFGPNTKTLRGYGPDDEDLSISSEESLYISISLTLAQPLILSIPSAYPLYPLILSL